MTVEFLDSDDPYDQGLGERPEDQRARRLRLADPVLSLVGGALLVLATFQTVYSVTSRDGVDPISQAQRVDGWGRLTLGNSGLDISLQATRVGILLCVAAATAVLGVTARLRHSSLRRLGRALGFVAVGVAAATVGHVVLDGLTAASNARDTSYDAGTGTPSRQPLVELDFGGFVWLGLAGTVCVLLALALPGLARSLDRPPESAEPAEPVALTDDGEQLG